MFGEIKTVQTMKILMFGRGVISTQYAWALEKAGHTVEFYVRPSRKAEWGSTVVINILDARKKIRGVSIKENWPVTLVEDFSANHDYDLILVSVQHYQFENAVDFLANRIGQATILIFNNVWEEPTAAVAKLPANQLVWGFPRAGGGFDQRGVLHGTLFGKVIFGTFGTERTARGFEVIKLFRSAGFRIQESKDFRSYLFAHFVANAALHFETFKSISNLTFVEAMQTTEFWKNVNLDGKELLPLLKARKVDLKATSELKIFDLPPWFLCLATRLAMKFIPSIKQIPVRHSNQDELKSYCQDVLATAEAMKIILPRFRARQEVFK